MTLDAAQQIKRFNAGREPERLQLKYTAMRASPFAFLRGSCHLFYARMARGGVHKASPTGWICGDLHIENFGSYQGDNGLVYFDINDFDESALAPLTWDLVRLLASVQVGAATLKVSDGNARHLCATLIEAYAESLALGKAYWVERDTAKGLIRDLLDELRDRPMAAFIDRRTRRKGRRLVVATDTGKALPLLPKQRDRVDAFMRNFARTQPDPRFFEVLDVARRIAGTGSLGVERYVILVRGDGAPDKCLLLDLKVSAASSLAPRLKVVQPRFASQAERIVATQRRLQAVPMDFLHALPFGDGSAVLRGLQPSEDRVEVGHAGGDLKALSQFVATLGRVVAWGHLRSAGQLGAAGPDELIAFGRRVKWRDPLLAAARECAEQAQADSAAFNHAFDTGAFEP